jgi:polysaccharide biosynthesis transport protein
MQPLQTLTPLPEPASSEGFIDIFRLLNAIVRFKWGILSLAFVIALATAFYVSTLTPIYRASASIVLEVQEANVVAVEDVYSLGRTSFDYFQTQFAILKSRNLAERVVRKLNLYESAEAVPALEGSRPWYKPDLKALLPARKKSPPVQLSEEEKQELAIRSMAAGIAGGLEVSPVEFSHMAYLSYESADPREAAKVVNTVAEEFINSNLDNRMSGTVQATDWLNERLATLDYNLRASEQALQQFRDQEGLVNVQGVTGSGNDELRMLAQRLEDARRTRIEAQNIKEEVQAMRGSSVRDWMSLPAVLHHELIRSLSHEQSLAERRVAELGKRYGTKHPKLIAAQSDLQVASAELAEEVQNVVSGISREYEVALRNERQLLQTWENSKSELQDFNRKEFRLQELQRELDTNQKLYDIFLTRIKSVSETGGFERPHARIVDRAVTPTYPVRPNKQRSVIIAFILGLLLGCGVAVLLDLLDNTIKTHDDVQEKLGAILLGAIPKMEVDDEDSFLQFWQKPSSQFAEAVRTVRTGVLLSNLDSPPKVIVVTSTVPGEGKSTTVLNLASAMGQMEKTLVIGADLRRPSLAKKCNITPNHPGLSHFVSGAAELDQCIEYLEDLQVHVMTAGLIPPNPLEMISSKRFVDALEVLKGQFDKIIIDSAPVQAVSDALVLASYADSIIYVVRADATSATQIKKGIAAIDASNEPFTGVVLNQFDAKKASKYYYGNKYYQYGEYYGTNENA